MCYFLSEVHISKIFTDGGNPKKVFGKRLIFLNKLLDDLGFWIEAQRYVFSSLDVFALIRMQAPSILLVFALWVNSGKLWCDCL